MNVTPKTLYIVGITMVFTGTLLAYFESYRNREYILVGVILLLFGGWGLLFMQLIKGTIIGARKIPFRRNAAKSFQQVIAKLFTMVIFCAITFSNLIYIMRYANQRKNEILQNGFTKITVAEISSIETSQGRSGTLYQAIFQYTANGQLISHPQNENKGDFTEGQKYEIKYAVEYPEMFKLVRLLPNS